MHRDLDAPGRHRGLGDLGDLELTRLHQSVHDDGAHALP
jgi:hypothetical protein